MIEAKDEGRTAASAKVAFEASPLTSIAELTSKALANRI